MKHDWQMLISSEAGGWVQRGSYTLLSCVCLEMSLMKSLKKKREKFQLSSGRVELNPGREGNSAVRRALSPGLKSTARPRGLRIHQPSKPSCLPTCSRLEISWDSPGVPDTRRVCPCHRSGVKAKPTTGPWNPQLPRCIVSAIGI